MAKNKIIYNGNTLIDLTGDTVTADKLLQGYTAHDRSGVQITGTATGGGTGAISVVDTEDTHGGTIRTITAVDISDTTAVASDVAQGKYFYTADGTKTAGTSSGGGGGGDDLKKLIDRSITTINFPSGITTIGEYAFAGCESLAITELPSTITEIQTYAFRGCKSITLTSLPNGVTQIGTSAFYNCANLALTSLPNTVTTIQNYAFQYCTGITSMSCEGNITTLGTGAFNGGTSYRMIIKSVSFPNMAVTSLSTVFGSSTASNACQLLEFADLGNTQKINANALANCYALTTLVLRRSDAICELANTSAFTNTPMRGYGSKTGTIYVPEALISTYQTATNWSTMYNAHTVSFEKIEGSQYDLS